MDESMTGCGKQEERTLSAKVGNHGEVLRVLNERLEAAEVQIRRLEREVYADGSQPTDKQLPGVGPIY